MSNRGYLLLLLFLPLLSNAKRVSAQNVTVQVQVYDYSGLTPSGLREFIARLEGILSQSGISAEVDPCPRGVSTACESGSGSLRQVVIRIVADAKGKKTNARWQHLGQSIAGHDGGTYGSIFLRPAQEEASEANLSCIVILAYAAAHEVGHLLLGDQAHTIRGLMRAHFEADEFQAMAQNRLHFIPEQVRELSQRYGTPSRAEVGSAVTPAGRRQAF